MEKIAKVFLILSFLFWALPERAQGAPGDPDTSFDGDGIVSLGQNVDPNLRSSAWIITPDLEGRIIAFGSVDGLGRVLVRFMPGGALDTTFGQNGVVSLPNAYKLKVQNVDGQSKILVLNGNPNAPSSWTWTMTRLNADGTRDTSFGIAGEIEFPISFPRFMVGADSKITLIGKAVSGELAIFRRHANGSPVTNFGSSASGSILHSFGGENPFYWELAEQADGKLIVAGRIYLGERARIILARILADGALDPTFLNGEKTIVTPFVGPSASYHDIEGIAVDRESRIIIAVSAFCGTATVGDCGLLVRFRADGNLDANFGTGGMVVLPSSVAGEIAVQEDNKVLSALRKWSSIARYNINGSLDTGYGSNGILNTVGDKIALDSIDRLLVAGKPSGAQFTLARHLGDSPTPSCFPVTDCPSTANFCGQIPDGCGGQIECGSCTPPETCGGAGVPNLCGVACIATTCAAQGKNCGTIDDGCGRQLACGQCSLPMTCGGGGTPNVCGNPSAIPPKTFPVWFIPWTPLGRPAGK